MLVSIGFLDCMFWVLLSLLVATAIVAGIMFNKWEEEKLHANMLAAEKADTRAMLIKRITEGIQSTLEQRYDDLKRRGTSTVDEVRWRLIEQDLRDLYHLQVVDLRMEYPELTDADISFILLVAVGVDNPDIALLLELEKRSIYRRRQLIAQRMGISSLDLDDLIKRRFV